jgi:hypothetical protein
MTEEKLRAAARESLRAEQALYDKMTSAQRRRHYGDRRLAPRMPWYVWILLLWLFGPACWYAANALISLLKR